MLSSLTIGALVVIYLVVGWVTDFAVARISPETEAEIFEGFMVDHFSELVPEELEEKWALAESIFEKLQSSPGVPPLPYRLAYSGEEQANAFAVPGGLIVLTRGLLETLEEEIAIAFVIAHEYGHFAGRDHLQRLGRQIGTGTALLVLTGGGSSIVDSTTQLVDLKYSRDEERAADRFALQSLDAVYGEREGAERLFEILEESRGIPAWAYMFTTHPSNLERIRQIREED